MFNGTTGVDGREGIHGVLSGELVKMGRCLTENSPMASALHAAPCLTRRVFTIRGMTPLDSYFDHGQRPRNMGRMLDAHGTGNIGSIVAGRALRWFVTIEGDRIAASKFQVFACQEQVAAAHSLEIIVGKTIEECHAISHADIAEAIGGLMWPSCRPSSGGLRPARCLGPFKRARWHHCPTR